MRRIRCDLRGQTLLIEQFVWKKLSWQPERRFTQGEIRAIVYGVLYGNMAQIWLRPQEGEDILFSDGLSSPHTEPDVGCVAPRRRTRFPPHNETALSPHPRNRVRGLRHTPYPNGRGRPRLRGDDVSESAASAQHKTENTVFRRPQSR